MREFNSRTAHVEINHFQRDAFVHAVEEVVLYFRQRAGTAALYAIVSVVWGAVIYAALLLALPQ